MELSESRLLVAANRLPATMKRKRPHEYEYASSSGGLATGLRGLARSKEFLWFGWPGMEIPPEDEESVKKYLEQHFNAYPVFLEERLAQRHYNGFSNSILWPLLHYFPDKASYDQSTTEAYIRVNELFAQQMIPSLRDETLVWVHDYHLMLLPAMLRDGAAQKTHNLKIGFFLHTPFPNRDFFAIIPSRERILKSLLACDLVGFHIQEYGDNFIEACSSILGAQTSGNCVEYQGKRTVVGTFPIGIAPEEFREELNKPKVKDDMASLRKKYDGMRLLVGVDRMDYIKGVPQKLQALDRFLSWHPEWVGKAVLIQVTVPSRLELEEYQRLRDQVNGLVGEVNGKYGSVDYNPVHLMHKSISKEDLATLYAISDVCLVSSTRDGMNLVSFEYVACQDASVPGSLIVSRHAGVSGLMSGPLVVNPWDIDEVAGAIHKSLTMDPDERRKRHDEENNVVQNITSFYWGRTFLKKLQNTEVELEESV